MFVHFTRGPWNFSKLNAYRVCFVVVVVVVFVLFFVVVFFGWGGVGSEGGTS